MQLRDATLLAAAVGLAAGVGAYTFGYARGASYLTDNAASCANCHVMRGHYDSWLKSSHRAVAVCNDCHTPVGLVGKYTTKAFNGFRHSFAFTTGRFPDPIRIHSDNLRITDDACRKCHAEVVDMIEGPRGADRLSCIRCHAGVGHS